MALIQSFPEGGVELLSSPIIIPKTLNWTDSSGHTEGVLTEDVTKFDHIIGVIKLFVTDYTPFANVGSWQKAEYWTKDMIADAVYAGVNNAYLYEGLLPIIIPGDAEKTLEDKYYSAHCAFGMKNNTTIRVNQSVITGWTASNFVFKLTSVKGYF